MTSPPEGTVTLAGLVPAGHPLFIWGARMTGSGVCLIARREGLEVEGFIDSDPSFSGRRVLGRPVYLPARLQEEAVRSRRPFVVISVALKEDEIGRACEAMGLARGDDYLVLSEHRGPCLTVDVAGACNLRCPACARGSHRPPPPAGFMTLDDLERVLDKALAEIPLLGHVALFNWGEPLLHPELPAMVQQARRRGLFCSVSSNLSVQPQRVEALVRARPDLLKVSLSGYSQAVYARSHAPGDAELVRGNLALVRREMDRCHPDLGVEVNYHLYRHNAGRELERMTKLCDELGFQLAPCYANLTPVEGVLEYYERGRFSSEQARRAAELLLVTPDQVKEITAPYKHLPCRMEENQVVVNWDRSVSLCCVTYERDAVVAEDFLQVDLEALHAAKEAHPLCRRCEEHGLHQYYVCVDLDAWDAAARETGPLPDEEE